MSSGFNLTAQLQLQAPTNTKQVATQIQSGLGTVSIPVQIQANPKALGGLNNQLKTTQKTALATGKNMAFLNRNIAEAARRFSVITVATGSFIALARGIKNSVKAAVEFERELIKISQVTGKSVSQLRSLTSEVTNLSTSLGVGNQSLLETARVLSQAGLSATKTKQAMEVLANTTLAPSFDNIIDTTEGAIAILNQFGREAKKTGQDIKFLEASLDAINQVSKNFAVESADLITAVRRTGGVFQAAGGSLNELIALFTSVRQTTRESAETIATGFRTIFTRLQRSETVDALKELGIALTDAEGKFIGPLKAIEALSIGLAGLDPKDIRFNEIVEQLGGFRQIGKVIPLIKQYSVAQQALAIANNAAGSTADDAQSAQKSLAVQFQKVTEQFDALIRKFADSETFRGLAKTVIDLATAFLKFAESLENVLPQLTALAAIKIGRNIAPGILGLIGGGGGVKKNMGGRIHGYAKGGWVPGTGSSDTVPAMLTPGEFVIKKSSAAKLGSGTLDAMNNNRYKEGGKTNPRSKIDKAVGIRDKTRDVQAPKFSKKQAGTIAENAVLSAIGEEDSFGGSAFDAGAAFLQPVGLVGRLRSEVPGEQIFREIEGAVDGRLKERAEAAFNKVPKTKLGVPVDIQSASVTESQSDNFKNSMSRAIGDEAQVLAQNAGMKFQRGKFDSALQSANIEQIEGNIFESWLAGMSDHPFDNKAAANDTFDFKQGLGSASSLFGLPAGLIADAKRTFSDDALGSITKKAATQLKDNIIANITADFDAAVGPEPKEPKKANKGGSISGSSDTVPALLTPGEFVVKKSAAQSIGYSNLSNMNKTGVAKFNKGGPVGIQTFANGGNVVESGDFGVTKAKDLALVNAAAKKNAAAFDAITAELNKMNLDPEAQRAALVKFSRSVDSAATEAELLQQAIDAAHSDITSSGDGAARTGKKPSGAAGAGGIDDSNKGHLSIMSGDQMAKINSITDRLAEEFENSIGETRAGQKAQAAFRKALNDGLPPLAALNAAREAGKKHEEALAAEAESLAEARLNSTMTEEELVKAELKLLEKTQAASKGRKPRGGAGGGGGGGGKGGKTQAELAKIEKSSKALSETFSKTGRVLNGLSNAAVGAMFIMGSLTESSAGLSEEQKKITQAGNNALTMHIAMATQIGSLVLETLSAIMASRANSAAKKAEALSAAIAEGANVGVAGSATAAAAALDSVAVSAGGQAATNTTKSVDPNVGGQSKAMKGANVAMAAFAAGMAVTTLWTGHLAKKTAEAVAALDIMIEKSNAAGDAELEKIGQKGQVADEEKFVTARKEAAVGEIDKGITQKVGAHNKDVATGAGTAGATAAAAAVFALAVMSTKAAVAFQAWPVVGQVVGAVLLGVAAAAAAIGAALWIFGKSVEEEAKKQARLRKLAEKASDGFARTTFRAQTAVANFDSAVTAAADANLSAAAQLHVLANGIDAMQQTVDEGNNRLSQATDDRVELETALKAEGLLSDTGRELESGANEDDKDRLGQLKELRKQEQEAQKSHNKLIQKLAAQEGALRQKINATLTGTLNEIAEANPDDLAGFTGVDKGTGVSSLKGLEDPTTAAGKKIKAMNQAIALATTKFEELVRSRFQLKIDAAIGAMNWDYAEALVEEREATMAQATAERVNNENLAAVAIQKSILSRTTELLVMRKQRDAIEQNNRAMRAFNDVMLGATQTADNFAKIDDIGSMEGGFGAVQIDASALDQPLQQLSKELLANTVNRGQINTAETGGAAFPGAKDIGQRIMNAKGLIDAIPDVFEGFKSTFQQGLPVAASDLFTKLEQAAGIAAGTLAGTPVGDIIQAQITDILKDSKGQPITAEQYQQIIDNIEETLDADLETIKRSIEIQNEFLNKLNTVNQAVIAQQQKFAEANARIVDVQERAADRMAQATGKPRDRGDKERGRLKAANRRLDGAKNFGAKAGNVDKTFDAAVAARDAARNAREQERQGVNQAALAQPGGPELTGANSQIELNKAANEGAQAFKNAKAELERMADQSARAGDIMAEIAQEQKARGQLKQLGENIAFGSDDQRKDIARGFNDLQMAVGQGGIQNANDGERARILQTLDSVADVGIGPVDPMTGKKKTGREIKAKFQADEIMRLTGNADLAQASFDQAMAGSKEEQLLKELAEVGKEEAKAAKALRELESQEVGYLKTIAQNTAAQFGPNVANAMANNAQDPAEKAKRDQITAELEATRAKALADLKTSQDNLKDSQTNLIQANKDLQAAIEGRQAEEDPKVKAKKEADAQKKFAESDQGKAVAQLGQIGGAFRDAAATDEQADWTGENNKFEAAAGIGLEEGNTTGRAQAQRAIERSHWSGDNFTVAELDKQFSEDSSFGANVSGAKNVSGTALEDSIRIMLSGTRQTAEKAGDAAGVDASVISAEMDNLVSSIMEKARGDKDKSLDQMSGVFADELAKFREVIENKVKPQSQGEMDTLARGGLVYRSVGGSIFRPRGTDTVPAMLTPGEFVVRKAAVDRIGMNALTAINNGDTSAVYKATGGGVGYNKSLNRNRIAGFRRGGMVGGQGTSYANSQGNGAVLQIDPSSIQSVLNEFNANFGNHIDNMIANLGTFAEAATSLATTITNGMDVRIVMSGDLATAVRLDGDQTEHLKNAIADSILPQIAENVAGTIEDKIRQLKDNP